MNKQLWQVTVTTTLEAEDAVGELLQELTGAAAALYVNEETKLALVSVYGEKGNWTEAKKKQLVKGLARIAESGLALGTGEIVERAIKREDWAESWKKHFKPIAIGSRLLIKPSWIKRKPRRNQAVIILDPGLSFGTGNHPTTAFCLHSLVKHRDAKCKQSFMDIGTGSGILAIAAAKLGYAPVKAFDFDKEAVRVARENAAQNKVAKLVAMSHADITKLSAKTRNCYDFVCANLISNLLIAERARISNRVRHGGWLVLAGILKQEFGMVREAYEKLGFDLEESFIENEWCSGCFRLKQ